MSKNIITVCGDRFDLSTVGGSFGSSHNEYRYCSRCESPLTDPASWERGVGPVCARKDTSIYAKTIPVNFTLATAFACGVSVSTLPAELQPVWTQVMDRLLKKASAAGVSNENFMAAVGQDVRSLAKLIDWMLSFRQTPTNKQHMIQLVKYLGFVGLASVLAGTASTGEAKVWFEGGRCYLRGSSNKNGWAAFRKLQLQGARYPLSRGSKEPYSVPAALVNRFVEIVSEFWPIIENDELDKVTAEAKQFNATNPAVTTATPVAAPSKGPTAVIRLRSSDFTLQFDWIRDKTPLVVDNLKKIAPSLRSYDPNSRSWFFRKEVMNAVRAAVDPVYTVTVEETNMVTPTMQYSRFSYYRR